MLNASQTHLEPSPNAPQTLQTHFTSNPIQTHLERFANLNAWLHSYVEHAEQIHDKRISNAPQNLIQAQLERFANLRALDSIEGPSLGAQVR